MAKVYKILHSRTAEPSPRQYTLFTSSLFWDVTSRSPRRILLGLLNLEKWD